MLISRLPARDQICNDFQTVNNSKRQLIGCQKGARESEESADTEGGCSERFIYKLCGVVWWPQLQRINDKCMLEESSFDACPLSFKKKKDFTKKKPRFTW